MAKKKLVQIYYRTLYAEVYEWLVVAGHMPPVFPPNLNVNWTNDTVNIDYTQAINTASVVTAELRHNWAYLNRKKIFQPSTFTLHINHKSRLKMFGAESVWEGAICGELQVIAVIHDFIHEIMHYKKIYELWKACHEDDEDAEFNMFDEQFERLYTFVTAEAGKFKDEKQNEAITLQLLAEYYGFNIKLLPKFDGPFFKKFPKNQLAAAMIHYYMNEWLYNFGKHEGIELKDIEDESIRTALWIKKHFETDEVLTYYQ